MSGNVHGRPSHPDPVGGSVVSATRGVAYFDTRRVLEALVGVTRAIPFGVWVRRRRRALELTQQRLGELVACATITVRKIETGERRPSRAMAERLADVLGIDTGERARFVAAARSWSTPRGLDPLGDPAGPSPLPASLTDLVGRDREMSDLARLLAIAGGPARLVTVTGPPGVGKTRLAIEVARHVGRDHDVSPAFVPLAAETEPAEIIEQLAGAYSVAAIPGRPRRDAVGERLRRQPELVILDNLEQLAGAGAVIVDLLEHCPDLACLCTSRTRLDVYGEYEFVVDPLAVDEDDGSAGPAVQLFVERCRAVGRRASVAADLRGVAEICRRLDGLPLAIELAARRTRDLALADLREDLGRGLSVLDTAGAARDQRHHTMSSTIAWSYELLPPDERRVLRAMGATSGSIAAAALAEVAVLPSESVAGAVSGLEAASLLRRGLDRVVVLEVVREFAEEQLRNEGEEHAARDRLAHWLMGIAERDVGNPEEWPGPEATRWMQAEDANLRGALRWTLLGPGSRPTGRRLLLAIALQWYYLGRVVEVRRWIEAALEGDADPEVAGPLIVIGAIAAWASGDTAGAGARLDQADLLSDRLPPGWRSEAIGLRATIQTFRGDLDSAAALLERALALATEQGSRVSQAMSHLRLGRIALTEGDLDAAQRHLDRSLARFEEVGSPWGIANATGNLAELALGRGDTEGAIDRALDAVEGMVEAGAEAYAVFCLTTLANALSRADRHEMAARLAGVVEEWLEHLGMPLFPVAAASYAEQRARTQEILGARDALLVAEGRLLPRDPEQLRRLVVESA